MSSFNSTKEIERQEQNQTQDTWSRKRESQYAARMAAEGQRSMEDAAQQTFTSLPKTPQRATSNSSRKLLHPTSLFRTTASPSHRTKMSALFEDAASSLQVAMATPSRNSSPYFETPPVLPSQHRCTRFVQPNYNAASPGPRQHRRLNSLENNNGILFQQFEGDHETVCYPTATTTTPRSNLMMNNGMMPNSPSHPWSPYHLRPSRTLTPVQKVGDRLRPNFPACEPISSGFATPAGSKTAFPQTSGPCPDPGTRSRRVPGGSFQLASQSGSSDDDEHSTHGVRLVLPYTYTQAEAAQQANIDAWLEKVLDDGVEDIDSANEPSSHDDIKAEAALENLVLPGEGALRENPSDSELESTSEYPLSSQQSSNKENVPPPFPSQPSRKSPSFLKSSFSTTTTDSPTTRKRPLPHPPSSTRRFTHQLTPGAHHLSAPPRRKKLYKTDDSGVPLLAPRPLTPHDNTVHDDDLVAALATLSPSVEQHRKGHGPKRDRCASFWDTDILEPDSPAYPTHRRLPMSSEGGEGKVLRSGKQVSC